MYQPSFTLQQEFTREVAENEVMLSFLRDMDAVAFSEWVESDGLEAFTQWLDKNKENYV